ncbi:MAG: hypothetical protein EBR82_48100 [Caulobacteraceae bacterium]|nr:hypothetical protein [Caulobacteraceae bacterium]
MASYLRQIADALAASLNTVSWGVTPVTIERKNWASVDIEGMANPLIYVTPGTADVQRIGRRESQIDYVVNVWIGRHVSTDQEVDDMLDLAGEVLLQIRAHEYADVEEWPAGVTSPQTSSIEINPDDALNDRNVWRAVITATYRVLESDNLPVE